MEESQYGTKGCNITSQYGNFIVIIYFGTKRPGGRSRQSGGPWGTPKDRLKLNPLSLQRPVDAGDNRLERGHDNVLVDADAEQR